MANDLISREAALEAIHNLQTASGWRNGLHEMDIHKVLLKIPAVDAAPVVHAYWIDRDGKTWCSKCGASNKAYKPPFCPHCGAKMDKEECMDAERDH